MKIQRGSYIEGAMPKVIKKGASMDKCLISIIIPVYQSAAYLDEAMNSITSQKADSMEIICIDDGSTDDSLKKLLKYARSDSRISVYSQDHLGVGEARNVGIDNAIGKYLYFMDSDDILKENALETMLKMAEKHQLDTLSFNADLFYDDSCTEKEKSFTPKYHRTAVHPEITTGQCLFSSFCQNKEYVVTVWMMLFKRSFLQDNHIRYYTGIVHNDNIFVYQSLICSLKAGYINESLYLRRIRPESIMTSGDYLRSSYSYAIIGNVLYEYYHTKYFNLSEDVKLYSEERINIAFSMSLSELRKCSSPELENELQSGSHMTFNKLYIERVLNERKQQNKINECMNELIEIKNSRLYYILDRIRWAYHIVLPRHTRRH